MINNYDYNDYIDINEFTDQLMRQIGPSRKIKLKDISFKNVCKKITDVINAFGKKRELAKKKKLEEELKEAKREFERESFSHKEIYRNPKKVMKTIMTQADRIASLESRIHFLSTGLTIPEKNVDYRAIRLTNAMITNLKSNTIGVYSLPWEVRDAVLRGEVRQEEERLNNNIKKTDIDNVQTPVSNAFLRNTSTPPLTVDTVGQNQAENMINNGFEDAINDKLSEIEDPSIDSMDINDINTEQFNNATTDVVRDNVVITPERETSAKVENVEHKDDKTNAFLTSVIDKLINRDEIREKIKVTTDDKVKASLYEEYNKLNDTIANDLLYMRPEDTLVVQQKMDEYIEEKNRKQEQERLRKEAEEAKHQTESKETFSNQGANSLKMPSEEVENALSTVERLAKEKEKRQADVNKAKEEYEAISKMFSETLQLQKNTANQLEKEVNALSEQAEDYTSKTAEMQKQIDKMLASQSKTVQTNSNSKKI